MLTGCVFQWLGQGDGRLAKSSALLLLGGQVALDSPLSFSLMSWFYCVGG